VAIDKTFSAMLSKKCTVLVGTGAASLGTTFECTIDRTICDEEVTGIEISSQWITGALEDGPLERYAIALTNFLGSGDAAERSIVEESRRADTLCGVDRVEYDRLIE
jgi:hypothetical protein